MKFWKILLVATVGTAVLAGLYVYNRILEENDYDEKECEELDSIYE